MSPPGSCLLAATFRIPTTFASGSESQGAIRAPWPLSDQYWGQTLNSVTPIASRAGCSGLVFRRLAGYPEESVC